MCVCVVCRSQSSLAKLCHYDSAVFGVYVCVFVVVWVIQHWNSTYQQPHGFHHHWNTHTYPILFGFCLLFFFLTQGLALNSVVLTPNPEFNLNNQKENLTTFSFTYKRKSYLVVVLGFVWLCVLFFLLVFGHWDFPVKKRTILTN